MDSETKQALFEERAALLEQVAHAKNALDENTEKFESFYDVELGTSRTFREDGVKAVINRAMNLKADIQAILALDMPDDLKPLRQMWALDKVMLADLKEHYPEFYRLVIKHVTGTPAKISIKLQWE